MRFSKGIAYTFIVYSFVVLLYAISLDEWTYAVAGLAWSVWGGTYLIMSQLKEDQDNRG